MIYLRVSTREQAEKDLAEGFSIPAQREAYARQWNLFMAQLHVTDHAGHSMLGHTDPEGMNGE